VLLESFAYSLPTSKRLIPCRGAKSSAWNNKANIQLHDVSGDEKLFQD